MKNLVLALSLALASGLAFAETETAEGDAPRGKPPGPPPHVLEGLDLTDEQRQEMRKIREAGGSREEMRSVLTPEQQEQFQSSMGAARKGEGDQRGNRGSGGMERLQRKLDLSDEQVAEMEKIRDEGGSRQEMFDVLTEEQRTKLDQLRGQKRGKPQGPRPEEGSA